MRKIPQIIIADPTSSKIKQINISPQKIFLVLFIGFLTIVFAVKFSVDIIIKLNHNSTIARLEKKNAILEEQLAQMSNRINSIREKLNQIENLDDKIRSTLDVPLLDEDVRKVGIGGSEISLGSSIDLDDPQLRATIIDYQSVLARLEREIKLETESYKKLLATVERKEDSLRYLPAIKPVQNGRITDRFGRRLHPILKIYRFHYGIDFAANRGTPVYAPADGYVTFTGRKGGFGLFISINHKYGYETYYGHLQKIYVRRGQFVKRGEKIGEVGNTGLSTNPHLHYEVHYKGKPVDPSQFYFDHIVYNE